MSAPPPGPWWGEVGGFALLFGLPLAWATVRYRRAERREREEAERAARLARYACRFSGCSDPTCPDRVVSDGRRSA